MDFEYSPRAQRLFARYPFLQKLDRETLFWFFDVGAAAMTGKSWLLPPFRAIGRMQINSVIKDPELRAKVTPADELGCKRVMLTDEWYRTLLEPNVDLVTDRIAEITPAGV